MSGPGQPVDPAVVQQQVRDHLMLNFTDMGNYANAEIPVSA